jgi:integrase
VRPDGHAKIGLKASETKARISRYVFATKEIVDWLEIIREGDYLFEGKHEGRMCNASLQNEIKRLYRKAGMKDSQDKSEIYCSHSLRTFAGDQLRN